jgi:hypothetical protein
MEHVYDGTYHMASLPDSLRAAGHMRSSTRPAIRDRRSGSFRAMQVAARVIVLGEAPLDLPTIDLSLGGVSLISPRQLRPGLDCLVEIGIGRPELLQPLSLHTRVDRCDLVWPNHFRTRMHFVNLTSDGVRKLSAMLR